MEPINYTLMGIPSGPSGVRATLKLMSKIVNEYKKNPTVRELALSLTSDLPPKKWANEAAKIHAYVRDNIRYIKDIRGVETLQTPVQTLRIGQGDCDDKSILTAALLESIGHPTRFAAIGFEANRFSHVLPFTKIAGKWLGLETTEPWPMGRLPKGVKSKMIQHN